MVKKMISAMSKLSFDVSDDRYSTETVMTNESLCIEVASVPIFVVDGFTHHNSSLSKWSNSKLKP